MLEKIFEESLPTKLHHWQISSNLSPLDEAKSEKCFSEDFLRCFYIYAETIVGRRFLRPILWRLHTLPNHLFFKFWPSLPPPPPPHTHTHTHTPTQTQYPYPFCCLVSLSEWVIMPHLMCYFYQWHNGSINY